MSTVERLRQLVSERFTAAAEEIFGIFERTIVEYEEEIDRQRRLLDIVWKPHVKLHRIDLQQGGIYKEEGQVLSDQLLYEQETSTVDQEDPDPPQIKEEDPDPPQIKEEDPDPPQIKEEDPDPPQIKEEDPDPLPIEEDPDLPQIKEEDPDPLQIQIHVHRPAENESPPESVFKLSTERVAAAAPNSVHPHSQTDESQNGDGAKRCDPEPNGKADLESRQKDGQSESPSNHACNSATLPMNENACESGKSSECFTFSCKTCGKCFRQKYYLKCHMLMHSGERPFSCDVCERRFCRLADLRKHMRIHTGERPYTCKFCGRDFSQSSALKTHQRRHTGEKPYPCETCGKGFCRGDDLKRHVRIHTGEKPYTCGFCGRKYRQGCTLNTHLKTHR